HVGEDRPDGSAGGIGNANGAILEACVDPGLLDFADQLLIKRLIGLGFALEGLVIETVRVEAVKLGLSLGNGLLQHGLAVDGLAVFDFDALHGVLARVAQLPLDLLDLSGGLAVLGVVGAVMSPDVDEFLAGIVQLLRERFEVLALRGDLGGLERAALDRFPGGFLAGAVGLGIGVLGVELQQPGGEDAGLLLGVDHVQFALKLDESGGGKLQFA